MRKAGQLSQTTIEILIIIGIIIVINILGQFWYTRADLTEDKIYTLAESSKEIVADLPDLMHMNVYISPDLPSVVQHTEQSVRDLLEEYRAAASARLTIQYINPDDLDDKEKSELAVKGITPLPYGAQSAESVDVKVAYFDIEIDYLGETEVIAAVPAERNLEYKISSSILKLIRDKTPTIGFLIGHGEMTYETVSFASPYGQQPEAPYKILADEDHLGSLYNLREIDLENGQKVPEEIDTLVISQPAEQFTERHKYVIDQFLMRGGKLVVMGNSVKMDQMGGEQAQGQVFPLASLLTEYGVSINTDLVADLESCWPQPCQIQVEGFPFPITDPRHPYPLIPMIRPPDGFPSESPVTRGLEFMLFPLASSLDLLYDKIPDETEPIELAVSSGKAYSYPAPVNLACGQRFGPPGGEEDFKKQLIAVHLIQSFKSAYEGQPVPAYDSDPENEDAIPQMDAEPMITASPETSLVVIGNADFVNNNAIGVTSNSIFFMNLMEYLNIGDKLIDIRTRYVPGKQLEPDLTPSKMNRLKFWGYIFIPILVTVIGMGRFYLKTQRKKLMQALHEAEKGR